MRSQQPRLSPTQSPNVRKSCAVTARRKTLEDLVEDFLILHKSQQHSPKTVEWHSTAIGLLVRFLETNGITDPLAFETNHLRHWVVWLGTPESMRRRTGHTSLRPRSKRTVNTYARSAHAFCRWMFEEGHTEVDITDHFALHKIDKPLMIILEEEEFQQLLAACDEGQHAREYALRDQAILWLLYDTGIRLSELVTLALRHLDLRTAMITVRGKGDKERRIALGTNALAALRRYLDHARPLFASDVSRDRVFLGDLGPLTNRGVEQIIRRLKRRVGFSGRRVSAHIFRHTFAVRYLMLGGDPFTLQQLLGHEDMETIRNYMHLNDIHIQTQKRKFSPGDHVQFSAAPRRRRSFRHLQEPLESSGQRPKRA